MKGNLSNFLVDLASDQDLMSRFQDDPARELGRWNERLTAKEISAILSRNSRQLREALDTRGDRAASDMVGTGGGGRKDKGKGNGARKTAIRKKPAGKRKGQR